MTAPRETIPAARETDRPAPAVVGTPHQTTAAARPSGSPADSPVKPDAARPAGPSRPRPPRLLKCLMCSEPPFETADADATCPGCHGDQLAPAVLIHFHPPGKGAARACDGKPVTNGSATGLPGCVTCPKCLAKFDEPPNPLFERGQE